MELEKALVYGPVKSRRFGWDLGVNLLPVHLKLCTFDCIYCQYGFTPSLLNAGFRFPTADQIIMQWDKQLEICKRRGITITHTTVSGNGEPTMHPHFAKVVPKLVKWRNENALSIKLALLSNGYRIHDPAVREALQYFDEPILKFDSAIPEKLRDIDQPLVPFDLTQYIEDLKKCKGIILQTMFIKGWNDGPKDLQAWRKALKEIHPAAVQIYTIDREPEMPGLLPISRAELTKISMDTSQILGLPVYDFPGEVDWTRCPVS